MRVVGEFFDEAEDVIPAAAVQTRGVFAQLVENLIHFKTGQDGLNEHGGLDAAVANVESVLRANEDVVPEARFQVALHLGQVEVRTRAACEQLFCVVEEVEAEVEDGAGHGLAVDEDMALFEVPSARADKEDGRFVAELVLLAA